MFRNVEFHHQSLPNLESIAFQDCDDSSPITRPKLHKCRSQKKSWLMGSRFRVANLPRGLKPKGDGTIANMTWNSTQSRAPEACFGIAILAWGSILGIP